MKYEDAIVIAKRIKAELAPHCDRIEIAGSIRRKKPEVGDIEIVCIPKPYNVDLFESGIATVINKWEKVKGELPCKYTQRLLPDGTKVDIFTATRDNWGLILAIRTGSAEFSHLVLCSNWARKGYKSVKGYLTKVSTGKIIPVREEEYLFDLIGIKYLLPENRRLMDE